MTNMPRKARCDAGTVSLSSKVLDWAVDTKIASQMHKNANSPKINGNVRD